MFRSIRHSPGFTFIELLIYMGLVSTIIVILTTTFLSLLDIQLTTRAVSAVEQDARFILTRVSHDIRRATSLTTPAVVGNSGSSLSLVISGAAFTYSLSSGNLQLTSPSGTDNLNSYDTRVSTFTITRLGNVSGKPSIQINLTLDSVPTNTTQVGETQSYQTTLTLR